MWWADVKYKWTLQQTAIPRIVLDCQIVVEEMAKTKTTPRDCMPKSVTAAAKWPNKTKKFLANIDAALSTFDDQVSSIDNHRETAYKTFLKAYREAFADIWPKITDASIKTLLQSTQDTELHEFHRMTRLMSPQKSQPTIVREPRTVATLDNILGSLVSQIPEQKLPDKEACALILTIFADLAKAHKHYANAARGLVDIVGLISPEQLTLVRVAAVPPTLQLVLLPGQISPLSAPPPPPTTATMAAGRQDMIKYCKNMILPDPAADAFKECDECTPTRVLAAAVFCMLKKHLFDETMPRAEIAGLFHIMAAQLHKAVTGVDYQSGPHPYKGKRKATVTDTTTPTKIQKTDAGLAPAPSTSGNLPSEDAPAKGTTRKPETGHPLTASLQAGETLSKDTLSSSSLEELPKVPFTLKKKKKKVVVLFRHTFYM